ncbi:hypothetical protein C2G38_2143911 [Gigaspora rosea]|uniref:Uncharacterized protein n=1 Tax=Gigaspora rosea TaxID=44941 RepID=A0A397UX56_9GLOM|nr:hypothetical protein C2G38_2143911 [Gigaspora rosea]
MNGPSKDSYTKYDKQAFFTYSSKNIKTFQHGYLGIEPSFIAGNFHVHCPIDKPLYLKWSMGDDISLYVNLTSLKPTVMDMNVKKIKLQLIELQSFKRILITHRLKAKIEFKKGGHLVFQSDIGIINSLTPKEIKEGKEKGLIYFEKS